MSRIGVMRKRVGIYSRADTEHGDYSAEITRTLVATVWAKVTNVSGTQQIDSRNAGAGVSHRIMIRNRTDLTKSNEIQYDGKWYTIATIQKAGDERNRFLILECREMDVDGTLNNFSPEGE